MNSEEHAALAILAGNKVCECGLVDDPRAIEVWGGPGGNLCWQCERAAMYEAKYAEREECWEYEREAEQWRRG